MMSHVMRIIALVLLLIIRFGLAFRVLNISAAKPIGTYFLPFDRGFVGTYGDPSNYVRERVNEGAFETPSQELIFYTEVPVQPCPGMVGPFSDGSYYCTAREFGYCDTRSGTCFCQMGYQGIDCSECSSTHFRSDNGTLCYPKVLCKDDCNGAGKCNFYDGSCECLPHRKGQYCETLLCSILDPLCKSCTETTCLDCEFGYYLTLETGPGSKVCGSCYDFDPRCAGCTKQLGCTLCADPTLTSIRRSGYRKQDPRLPLEEDTREFSITLPFGSKSPEAFADAENFYVCTTPENPLRNTSTQCIQGMTDDDSWECSPYAASHRVCGHLGVFKFLYPNYRVYEGRDFSIDLTVQRSGGGCGDVSINYYIHHFTTNDSDVTATACYTTSQKLHFGPGVVQRTFRITILDDVIVEENEVFQVVLETPGGGGSIGAQFRTNVTIIDDDGNKLSAQLTKPLVRSVVAKAAVPFSVSIQATLASGDNMTTGGELFFPLIENDMSTWSNPGTISGAQRNALRTVCSQTDNLDGTYTFSSIANGQGNFQMRIYHVFPGGLKGDYFIDAYMDELYVDRIDRVVNFTWGTGRLIPRGADFISIRWTGVIGDIPATNTYYFQVDADEQARLWVDGDLLIDHYHIQAVYLEPPRPKVLQAGGLYEVVLEYREVTGTAYARLMWGLDPTKMEVIPTKNLFSLYEIGLSPVNVTINSGETVASTTECVGNGLVDGTVLQRSEFSACPRDIYGNLRDDDNIGYLSTAIFGSTVTLIDDNGYNGVGKELITPVMTFNNNTFCFDFFYVPERAGTYRVDIFYQTWHDQPPEPVAGSPFTCAVKPTKTFGPYSNVFNLPMPLYLEAGTCHDFTIVARDMSRNLRHQGGDDFEVYMYQVNHYFNTPGTPLSPSGSASPTPAPVAQYFTTPTHEPTVSRAVDLNAIETNMIAPPLETSQIVVRDGIVTDMRNGNYTVEVCPVIAGWYEIHVLLNGAGVSNQLNTIINKVVSYRQKNFGQGSFLGQYVANSPYFTVVSHTSASAYTTSAVGPGLVAGTVGIPVSFMITVRDPWDNVMRTSHPSCAVAAFLDLSPEAEVVIWNYNNGSYHIQYTPAVSGLNLVTVTVDSVQIPGSPFQVPFVDGRTSASFSYAVGPGLQIGTTGVTQYFQLFAFDFEGNRKSAADDIFIFKVHGRVNVTSQMIPCPKPPSPSSNPICDPSDTFLGHYYGYFTPTHTGDIVTAIYLQDPKTAAQSQIMNSPFHARIFPSSPHAEGSDVGGTLYDNMAGVNAYVTIQLRDYFGNKLEKGGGAMELVLLGVAVEWGTIEPWTATPGLQDAYHYKGFYAGYPNVYGEWVDYGDGSYTAVYNATLAGQYVMRLSVAEAGLNATYFNNTNFGYLTDGNFNKPGFAAAQLGVPQNFRTSISWTGDIGGPHGPNGARGSSTYFQMFDSRMEPTVNFNLTMQPGNQRQKDLSETAYPLSMRYRENYWSARWVGMITPQYAERYNFTLAVDPSSSVTLHIGGVGTMLNGSNPGVVVINSTGGNFAQGLFAFSDAKSREFVLEYIHYDGPSYLTLYWQSASTPLAIIPPSAFTHWRNISHFNTTIHPNVLCSHCSTVYGAALTHAVVDVMKSFVVYGRDVYGNLLQRGGDVPTMVAIGRDGVAFRGKVTDYGNSTYLIEYYATVAGQYRMYVTIGCCPPNPNVGLPAELEMIDSLLVQGAPFLLTVEPSVINSTRTIAVGDGLIGGIAGMPLSFTTLFRDIHNNPTHSTPEVIVSCTVTFVDISTGKLVETAAISTQVTSNNLTTVYNLTNAGMYEMFVEVTVRSITAASKTITVDGNTDGAATDINMTAYFHSNRTNPVPSNFYERYETSQIVGSPFNVIISPSKVYPPLTLCRGLGLRQAAANRVYSFEIQTYDVFGNSLLVGGAKFFIRLYGDANFQGAHAVVPFCVDAQNGAYTCQYTAAYSGPHELTIKVLNNSFTHPGGSGLTGRYYTSSSRVPSVAALYTTVDAKLSFSWPTGFLIPAQNIGQPGSVPLISVGQSIRWDGFLVSPRTDSTYRFGAWAAHMNASIYIDSVLVYDTALGIQTEVSLQQDSAYEIYIEVFVSTYAFNVPTSLTIVWSTSASPWALIPGFYLYDSATNIPLSPFPVSVL